MENKNLRVAQERERGWKKGEKEFLYLLPGLLSFQKILVNSVFGKAGRGSGALELHWAPKKTTPKINLKQFNSPS